MDIDAYYRELDKRMNLPDDDLDEYLNRIGAYRKRSDPSASYFESEARGCSNELEPAHISRVSAARSIPEELGNKMRQTPEPTIEEQREADGAVEETSSERAEADSNVDPTTSKIPFSKTGLALQSPRPASFNEIQSSPQARKRKASDVDGPDISSQKRMPITSSVSPKKARNNAVTKESSPQPTRAKSFEMPTPQVSIASESAPRSTFANDISPSVNDSNSYGYAPTPSAKEMPISPKFSVSPKKARNNAMTKEPLPSPTRAKSLGLHTPQVSIISQSAPRTTPDEDILLLDSLPANDSNSSEYAPTPSAKQTSPLKRKATREHNPLPRKLAAAAPSSSTPRTPSRSIEDITSFSTNSIPVASRRISKDKPVGKGANMRKVPALELKAITLPARDAPRDAGPPTSPIDEVTPVTNSSGLQTAPSKLYLEVKQRIAQHATARRRDKVIKVPPKPIKPGDITDDDSIIYVSSSSPSRRSSPVTTTGVSAKVSSKKPQPSSSKNEKDKTKVTAAKGKKKEKPAQMTPVEYAQKLHDKYLEKTAAAAKNPDKQPSPFKFLSDKVIFYTGGDMQFASERTRGRMDIIMRYGGNLLPRFDASQVTHIVTDAPFRSTLRALGLKRLSDIPDHIPTVTWDWIVSAIGRAPIMTKEGLKVRMDETFMHAAFVERIDAGAKPRQAPKDNGKGKGRVPASDDMEFSRISEFTQDRPRRASRARSLHELHGSEDDEGGGTENDRHVPTGAPLSPPTSPIRPLDRAASSSSRAALAGPSGAQHTEDPLAEFYARARAEHETGWARRGEVEDSEGASEGATSEAVPSDSDAEEPIPAAVPTKRARLVLFIFAAVFADKRVCADRDGRVIPKKCSGRRRRWHRLNGVRGQLEELKTLHQAKIGDEDHWRVFSYSKCIRALRNHPKRIASLAEARSIRGVGEKTAAKIMEIVETGGLRRIGYEKTEDIETTRLFQGIYGVGRSTAYQWYAAGCRTLKDVVDGKGGVKLTPAQEIGVRFYDDINNRMPREEAKEIFELIKPIALRIDPRLFVEIMGSYRRGKADCGDIDILITRSPEDGKTHAGVLPQLLRDLHAGGILTEDLALPDDPNDLEAIYRGLCRIPWRAGARRRRIDFLTVAWHSRGAALLYYTGDDIFNRAIRMKANVLGYSLNEKGLFGGVVRDPRDRRVKLHAGRYLGCWWIGVILTRARNRDVSGIGDGGGDIQDIEGTVAGTA
ncbi:hypothetical protein D9615_007866 [Tricholomella constricta]|uniref:DNA polymerase lambda n=1 Tax=Tricholomella constricta TaxID=117010 RepID=A0A8H5H4S2_9AGAR|nr:hypothetical protein D9615_007866 [Tricholomella constricta]